MTSLKDELLEELTREEARRLAEITRQQEAACSRLEVLRAKLAVLSAEKPAQAALLSTPA